ncbi:unnamed protein product, partial [marine sediment metagenome]
MTKQEEIREGLAKQLAQFDGHDWDALSLVAQGTYRGRAIVLCCHLHSQDVVIKVEREADTILITEGGASASFPVKLLEKAGYV